MLEDAPRYPPLVHVLVILSFFFKFFDVGEYLDDKVLDLLLFNLHLHQFFVYHVHCFGQETVFDLILDARDLDGAPLVGDLLENQSLSTIDVERRSELRQVY